MSNIKKKIILIPPPGSAHANIGCTALYGIGMAKAWGLDQGKDGMRLEGLCLQEPRGAGSWALSSDLGSGRPDHFLAT